MVKCEMFWKSFQMIILLSVFLFLVCHPSGSHYLCLCVCASPGEADRVSGCGQFQADECSVTAEGALQHADAQRHLPHQPHQTADHREWRIPEQLQLLKPACRDLRLNPDRKRGVEWGEDMAKTWCREEAEKSREKRPGRQFLFNGSWTMVRNSCTEEIRGKPHSFGYQEASTTPL